MAQPAAAARPLPSPRRPRAARRARQIPYDLRSAPGRTLPLSGVNLFPSPPCRAFRAAADAGRAAPAGGRIPLEAFSCAFEGAVRDFAGVWAWGPRGRAGVSAAAPSRVSRVGHARARARARSAEWRGWGEALAGAAERSRRAPGTGGGCCIGSGRVASPPCGPSAARAARTRAAQAGGWAQAPFRAGARARACGAGARAWARARAVCGSGRWRSGAADARAGVTGRDREAPWGADDGVGGGRAARGGRRRVDQD